MGKTGTRGGDASGGGARDWRAALRELVGRPTVRRDGAEREPNEPEDLVGAVERTIAQLRTGEGIALERCAELERRLDERAREVLVLAEELRRSYHETKLERRARERLAERIGHGMVAPLANLVGLVEASAACDPLETGRAWITTAARLGRALFEDAESWCLQVDREPDRPVLLPFFPEASLERVLERVRPLAESRGLLLDVYDKADEPIEVLGDPRLFEASVEALAQHAIERTTTGFVALETSTHVLDDETVALLVQIEDTAALDGDSHGRADTLERAARALVERQGGWLERRTDPERGGGWRLTLELPIRRESPPAARPTFGDSNVDRRRA
ncbi:MAG: hypothetical protein R3F34_06410 [Planctomycetota bacterium]